VQELEEELNVTVNTKEEGNLKEIKDKTEIVKTGMIIKYTQNGRTYKVSVLGDINGDGNLDQIELTKEIREYLKIEKWRITDELEKLSADITCDGNIDDKDIESIIDYIVLGKLEVAKVEEILAPQVEVTEGFETETAGWYNSNVKVKIAETINENEEGTEEKTTKTVYKIEGTENQEETEIDKETEIELQDEGVYKITAYTYGALGNKSKGTTAVIVINAKIGVPEITAKPTDWTNQKVEVTMTSDIEEYDVEYRIDEGEWTTYTDKLEVEENCKIEARITDGRNHGTIVEKEITNIDTTMPVGKIEATGVSVSKVSLKLEGQDEELSGIKEIKLYAKEENAEEYECKETIEYEQDGTEHEKKQEEVLVSNLKDHLLLVMEKMKNY
jgi:hypothetical protein